MATGLKDKNDGVYDRPGHVPSQTPSNDDLRDITGISPEKERDMVARAKKSAGPEGVAAAEKNPQGSSQATEADNREGESLGRTDEGAGDQVGKGFTKEKPKKGRFRSSRKKKTMLGFVVGLIISTAAIGFQQGPNFTIQHLREQLLGKLSELQTGHTLRYRRRRIHRVQDMFSRDGRRGGRVIADMQSRGWTFRFNRSGDMVGLRPPHAREFLEGEAIGTEINTYLERRHPLRTSRWKTNRMEAFYRRYRVARRSVVVPPEEPDADPRRTLRQRMASQVVPEEPDTRLAAGEAGDDLTEEEQAAYDTRRSENQVLAEGDNSVDGTRQEILNGTPIEELTPEQRTLLQSSNRVDQNVIDTLENLAPTSSLFGRAFNAIKGFASATDIADRVCTMKNRLRAISFAARNYRALSLLRYASLFVGSADEIRKGDLGEVDPVLVSELFRQVAASDANGNSIGASPGFAYMLKGQFSRSRNDDFKSNVAVDGSLTGVPGALDSATDQIPGVSRSQCRVLQNPGFQIGVAVVEVAVAVFTGGGSEAGVQAGKEGAKQALRAGLRRLISRQTAASLAQSAAIEITFEGALLLLQVYAEKAATLNFTGQEQGAELGDILVAGGGVMNKQRSLQAGQVPATAEQYDDALGDHVAWKEEENKKKNVFARVLDYHNYDSLTFKAASKLAAIPYNAEGIGLGLRNMLHTAASTLTKPFSAFSEVLSARVGAQDSDEVRFAEYTVNGGSADDTKLATDPAGSFLPILRTDIASIDPTDNIDYLINSEDIDPETLQPTSDNFTGHVENCVEAVDLITTIENEDQSDPEYDCLATQPITVRYKAHLAYLDMLDGIDASLFPDEIPDAGGTSYIPQTAGVAVGQ